MNETTELIMKQLNQKKTHAITHEVGGGDEVDATLLKNYLNDGSVTAEKLATNLMGSIDNVAVQQEFDYRGLNVMKFGAKGDGVSDDTGSLETALQYAFDHDRFFVYLPEGTYNTTRPLLIKTKREDASVDWWQGKAIRLVGAHMATTRIVKTNNAVLSGVHAEVDGIDSTLILFAGANISGGQGGSGTGVSITNLFIENQSASTSALAITGSACDRMEFQNLNIKSYKGISFGTSFSNIFRNIRFQCTANAFTITEGTSNIFEFFYVSACLNPYLIDSSYSNLLSLAADNCTGTVYELGGFGLVMESCGAESPKAQYIVRGQDNNDVTIVSLFIHRQTGDVANGLDIATCAVFTGGPTKIKVLNLSILENEAITGNSYVYTANDANTSLQLEMGRISYRKNYSGTTNPKLLYNLQHPAAAILGSLTYNGGMVHTRRNKYMPYIGSRGVANTLVSPFLDKAIYLDNATKTTDAAANDLRFQQPYNVGDLLLINAPSTMNILGYTVTAAGADVNGCTYAEIPISIRTTTAARPTANLFPGLHVFDTTLNKPIWRNAANSAWLDATGTAV